MEVYFEEQFKIPPGCCAGIACLRLLLERWFNQFTKKTKKQKKQFHFFHHHCVMGVFKKGVKDSACLCFISLERLCFFVFVTLVKIRIHTENH